MNPWIALGVAGRRITDERLKAAWQRMLATRHPEDCALAEEIADDTPNAIDFWRLAWKAGEYARAERELTHALVKMGIGHE